MPFATTWMDLEDIMRKSDGERQILYIITCLWNLKTFSKKNEYNKTETDSKVQRKTIGYQWAERRERTK